MIKQRLKQMDYPLIIVIFLLSLFGLLMVYSASFPIGIMGYDDATFFFMKQLKWFLLGLGCFIIVSFIPYSFYGKISPILVFFSIGILFLVLTPEFGLERNNSQRWIQIGPLVFQPTEPVKLFMIIYFAFIYAKKQTYIDQFKKGVLPPLIVLAVVFLLILRQPDFGSATLILASCGIIVVCAGIRYRHLLMLSGIALTGFIYFAKSSSYRIERLTSFRNAFDDPLGEGYQLVHSYIAIGASGLFGNGLGNSIQKLGYLPEAHTDFIMAIILEEIGIVGLGIIIFSYIFILLRGIRIASSVDELFPRLLAIGLTFQLMTQAIINLGAVSGLLPITGVTLPFISYGGSSLVFMMISSGILVSISTNRRASPSKYRKGWR